MAGEGDPSTALRILEFYSGVGGMHFAAKGCGVGTSVVSAFDINTLANSVYSHNFKGTPVSPRNIESLSPEELDKFNADAFLMSPPCQPYTRQGLQAGSTDPRSQSFLALLDALPKLQSPPRFILIENVKGFDTSETRDETVRILECCSYVVEEYLLSPLQCGIPNSRLRYYLLACRRSGGTAEAEVTQPVSPPIHRIRTELPALDSVPMTAPLLRSAWQSRAGDGGSDSDSTATSTAVPGSTTPQAPRPSRTCSGYADGVRELHCAESSISALPCPSACPSVCPSVCPSACPSACSHEPAAKRLCTDASSARSEGSRMVVPNAASASPSIVSSLPPRPWCPCGSRFAPESTVASVALRSVAEFLQSCLSGKEIEELLVPEGTLTQYRKVLDVVQPACGHSCCFTKNYGRYLRGTGSVLNCAGEVCAAQDDGTRSSCPSDSTAEKLRYFSPQEVASLMCFPADFAFPEQVTAKQRYRCLGNSLNVLVVAWLLRYLFTTRLSAAL